MRLLKMDKEGAADTYDAFQTTLNPTGVPNRAGIDNLVRSLQAQGRFTDRKVIFNEVADDRLATEVAKEFRLQTAMTHFMQFVLLKLHVKSSRSQEIFDALEQHVLTLSL